MNPQLNVAIKAARRAGDLIARNFDQRDRMSVAAKGAHDFVTSVDKAAESEIIHVVQKAYPNHQIIAEERGIIGEDNTEYTWIIDPLDGTVNYIHGFPQFAVSIAIAKDNVIQQGVIYDPITQDLFTASKGEGAQLNGRRIRVSGCVQLEKALLATGFACKVKGACEEKIKDYLGTVQKMLNQCLDIRRAGACALDLAYVAAGRLDGFWEESIKSWDLAAGALMVQEAGGFVSDFNGENNYLTTGNIIAATPKIFNAIVQAVQE